MQDPRYAFLLDETQVNDADRQALAEQEIFLCFEHRRKRRYWLVGFYEPTHCVGFFTA